MIADAQPTLVDIVLVGGGHSHVGVLKSFAMNPLAGVRLTLICTDLHTPYSGMLPGYIAGHYCFEQVHIDLLRLCQFAGARIYHEEVIGIDRTHQKVLCKSRPPVAYDWLSINIGSTPQLAQIPGALQYAVAVKPIRNFNARWLALLDRVKHHATRMDIAVVGAGAGGVELLLAMQYRLRKECAALGQSPAPLQFHLLAANDCILPTHNRRVRAAFAKVLSERGVHVHLNSTVTRVERDHLITRSGQRIHADEIIWATHASGSAWLKTTGLALDQDGFIEVSDTLVSSSDPRIFAAGDVAALRQHKLEKAGVFAVRMAKPLAQNLRRAVSGKALLAYRPQAHWLSLISTGDRFALASRASWSLSGKWVWRWKDWIDQGFMRKFSIQPEMMRTKAPASAPLGPVVLDAAHTAQAMAAMAMRCSGCAAKVGSSVLQRALETLRPMQRSDILLGINEADDAAVIRIPSGMLAVHSVDFFRSFIDDPFVFGKIAANHCLGDLWAMGAQAQSATAICTIPPSIDDKVQEQLFQLLSGALETLNDAQCALIGGHTAEGRELALGFAVNGLIEDKPQALLRKRGMKPGDVLILTKPLGSGCLLAAKDRLFAQGDWIDEALVTMMQSNQMASRILYENGANACTDITGFGLLGHLLEMTGPSQVNAEIHLDALPLMSGALNCAQAGISSSLHSANLQAEREIHAAQASSHHPHYPLLFDPQTAGPLLASVPPHRAEPCIAQLRARGYLQARTIGTVIAQNKDLKSIALIS